jgi:hypothetical protein
MNYVIANTLSSQSLVKAEISIWLAHDLPSINRPLAPVFLSDIELTKLVGLEVRHRNFLAFDRPVRDL